MEYSDKERRRMSDREMLMLAYGAIKAGGYSSSKEVVEMLEAHIFGPKPVIVTTQLMKDMTGKPEEKAKGE